MRGYQRNPTQIPYKTVLRNFSPLLSLMGLERQWKRPKFGHVIVFADGHIAVL